MARPQQVEGRRQQKRQATSHRKQGQAEDDSGHSNSQALPIADLPADFSDEPEDGQTYLALANRTNASLPFFTRVPDPYARPKSPTPPLEPDSIAGPSRHPALPKESWQVLFPIHFINYRKHLAARWPPSPPLPYPPSWPSVPLVNDRTGWRVFVEGLERDEAPDSVGTDVDRAEGDADPDGNEDENEVDVNVDVGADVDVGLDVDGEVNGFGFRPATNGDQVEDEGGIGAEEGIDAEEDMDIEEEDEEAFLNMNDGPGVPDPDPDPLPNHTVEEDEKYKPHPPLISVIQHLNSNEISSILNHLKYFLQINLPNISPTSPFTFITPNIFPQIYAQWIFALLLILPTEITGHQISTLREIARAAMRLGGWRWVRAVTLAEVSEGWEWAGVDLGMGTAMGMGVGKGPGVGDEAESEEKGVERVLGRCWLVVWSVAVGWGQRDLIDELEGMFK